MTAPLAPRQLSPVDLEPLLLPVERLSALLDLAIRADPEGDGEAVAVQWLAGELRDRVADLAAFVHGRPPAEPGAAAEA